MSKDPEAIASQIAQAQAQAERLQAEIDSLSGKLRKCKLCQAMFEPKKPSQVFCKPAHRDLYWKTIRQPDVSPRKCKGCDRIFVPDGHRRVFHSEDCYLEYKRTHRQFPECSHRASIIAARGFRCELCGRQVKDGAVLFVKVQPDSTEKVICERCL